MSGAARGGARPLWQVAGALALGLALGTLALLLVARPMRVEGNSMAPGLRPGDVLVVLVAPGAARMAGPGDLVVARPAGAARTPRAVKRVRRIAGTATQRRFELVGDNPARSVDSRQYGQLPASRIEGLVLWRLYPPPFSVAEPEALPAGR